MCSTDEWHMYPKRERRLRCFQADSTVYLLPLHLYSGRSYSSWTSLEVATMLRHLADQKQMAKSKWQTKPPSSINPCTVNVEERKKRKKGKTTTRNALAWAGQEARGNTNSQRLLLWHAYRFFNQSSYLRVLSLLCRCNWKLVGLSLLRLVYK